MGEASRELFEEVWKANEELPEERAEVKRLEALIAKMREELPQASVFE